MNCEIIRDLIPLYIDGCCSEESSRAVEEHLGCCSECKKLYEDMRSPSEIIVISQAPKMLSKLNDRKASVMQSVLLFAFFALITIGVALEARTPVGKTNGIWALNLIVPATGFMLSLANWYFVRAYKSRKSFSLFSALTTAFITVCGYIWSVFHYGAGLLDIFVTSSAFETVISVMQSGGIGVLLTVVLCILSKLLSSRYAVLLGKE
ncbi:MAG: zf-HC2 domain-containing protein [Clostridia bacterium]|nr:zf-HC2 domain-containing protein [Clostridia bacterium]